MARVMAVLVGRVALQTQIVVLADSACDELLLRED
jgi:hypothetical protein